MSNHLHFPSLWKVGFIIASPELHATALVLILGVP